MAQRKPPTPASRKSGSKASDPAAKGSSRPGAARSGTTAASSRPAARKSGRSIVNQKQTPWGLIVTTVVLVLFAAAVVVFAVTRSSDPKVSAADKAWAQPELSVAKAINGVSYKAHPDHGHVAGTVKYDTSPPTGGNHSQYWADCTGKVYASQIADENAVHMLEHGAIWITYNPDTATAADLAALQKMVAGVDRMALSPFAGLKTRISLQAWNYQLFVDKATDPRIQQFIDALRFNPKNTPEPAATCADPSFKADQSTPGHPFNG